MSTSPEVMERFHSIYNGNTDNLKKVTPALLAMGLGYMEILLLAKQELNLSLADAIMHLQIPDILQ